MRALRTQILPALTLLLGVALMARSAAAAAPLGVLLGALFVAAGAGRIYVERRR